MAGESAGARWSPESERASQRHLGGCRVGGAVSFHTQARCGMPQFVVHEHYASTHHYDFRLERDGVFKSWVLPKGLPEQRGARRLAISVDDHDLDFGGFEGRIPEGEYGAGVITIWDRGSYESVAWSDTRIVVDLHGDRVKGRYELVRFSRKGPREWLMFRIDSPLSSK